MNSDSKILGNPLTPPASLLNINMCKQRPNNFKILNQNMKHYVNNMSYDYAFHIHSEKVIGFM